MTRIAITCVAPHERIKAAKNRSRKVAGCSTPGTCLIQRSKAKGIMVYANAIARLPAISASSRGHCHCKQIPWGSHEMSVDDMAGQAILQLVKFSSLWDMAKAIPKTFAKTIRM
jgi:hypothetical protein